SGRAGFLAADPRAAQPRPERAASRKARGESRHRARLRAAPKTRRRYDLPLRAEPRRRAASGAGASLPLRWRHSDVRDAGNLRPRRFGTRHRSGRHRVPRRAVADRAESRAIGAAQPAARLLAATRERREPAPLRHGRRRVPARWRPLRRRGALADRRPDGDARAARGRQDPSDAALREISQRKAGRARAFGRRATPDGRRRAPPPGDPWRSMSLDRTATGLFWEDVASAYLERRGLKTLLKRYRCRVGEIDLVCAEGTTLVIVGVRARRGGAPVRAPASLHARKQRRSGRAARPLLMSRPAWRERPVRFDVVAIDGIEADEPEIEWIRAAFDAA